MLRCRSGSAGKKKAPSSASFSPGSQRFQNGALRPGGINRPTMSPGIRRVRDQSELSFSATHFIGQSRKFKNSVRPFFLRQRLRRKGLMPAAQPIFLTRSSGEPASGASCFSRIRRLPSASASIQTSSLLTQNPFGRMTYCSSPTFTTLATALLVAVFLLRLISSG